MNTSIKSINETNEKLCYVMDLKKEYGPNKVGKENYAKIEKRIDKTNQLCVNLPCKIRFSLV